MDKVKTKEEFIEKLTDLVGQGLENKYISDLDGSINQSKHDIVAHIRFSFTVNTMANMRALFTPSFLSNLDIRMTIKKDDDSP